MRALLLICKLQDYGVGLVGLGDGEGAAGEGHHSDLDVYMIYFFIQCISSDSSMRLFGVGHQRPTSQTYLYHGVFTITSRRSNTKTKSAVQGWIDLMI